MKWFHFMPAVGGGGHSGEVAAGRATRHVGVSRKEERKRRRLENPASFPPNL